MYEYMYNKDIRVNIRGNKKYSLYKMEEHEYRDRCGQTRKEEGEGHYESTNNSNWAGTERVNKRTHLSISVCTQI